MIISRKRIRTLITAMFMVSLLALSAGCATGSSAKPEDKDGPVPEYDCGEFIPGSTSVEMAANMAIGWNLGNTMDAHGDWTKDKVFHSDLKGLETETGWGMPKTTKEMIDTVHKAGFKTIRIPISWHNHIKDANYTIDSNWMSRVKQIVDWAYDQDMCVIINIHHDNLTAAQLSNAYGFALSTNTTIQEQSKAYISKVWTQVATTFADYDNKLVFEILNEPRDVGGVEFGDEWNYSGKDACDIITSYEQAGLDAIRAVPGNKNRFVMVPGYAASGTNTAMLRNFTFPTDTATDKLILSGHAYSPYIFAMGKEGYTTSTFEDSFAGEIRSIFSYLKTNYINKGIGVVMGEASATDKKNTAERIKWVNSYYTNAKAAGIPVILWDNMNNTGADIAEHHGYFNRNTKTWFYPSIIEAMMKVVYGADYADTNTTE